MINIKLEAENKAIKLRNDMLEKMVQESHNISNRNKINPQEIATFRIIQEENKLLKQLIKDYMNKPK